MKRNSEFGFSLTELLVVIAVLLFLVTLSVPLISSVMRSSSLNAAGTELVQALTEAQQQAANFNTTVVVEFIRHRDPDSSERGFYTYRLIQFAEDGSRVGFGGFRKLPAGMVITDDNEFSTLLAGDNLPVSRGITEDAFEDTIDVIGFEFLPDGGTNLPNAPQSGDDQWFVTILPARFDLDRNRNNLKNFVTVQIDPATGAVTRYQP